jgi:anti-sigma factor RsiW
MNCQTIQPLLSEYIDNALSARDTWEVDKHLAECNACALALNEMRATVRLLGETPRFEVSDDFMEKLQARIAAVEPEPPRAHWLSNLRELFRQRALPVWGAAAGACALAAIVFITQVPGDQGGIQPPVVPASSPIVQTARNQSVALAAANPLGDPAAAALIAANAAESSESSSSAQ